MPEFKKRTVKFQHKGMQWNRTIDNIPEEQICIAKNCRVNQQGAITQRPGHTLYATLGGTYTHSIARMNNFNTGLIAYTSLYVVGQDNSLYVGATAADLAGANNPIALAGGTATNTLSGNPLTMVDMAPVGTNIGWKYIGDSSQNFSVGKYPADATSAMARSVTMGMTPPVNTTIPATVAAAGNLDGDYQWRFAYRNRYTGARSNPSAPTRVTLASPALTCVAGATGQATMTVPTTPIDPQTGAADANILVDIYRYGGTIFDWRFVGTASSGGTFVDDIADASILTAPTPPQITDPVTGVTRYNLFRPFVIQDNAVYSAAGQPGTITIEAKGTFILTADTSPASNPTFDVNWLPGSVISINNNPWTIFQVRSSTVIEIAEDATGNLATATTYPWATLNGTLKAGAPLPHIWGPYGLGESGAVIFGCGSTNRAGTASTTAYADAGTLYWTNGNDPDSTDLTNSLLITSPSEPLCGGCIYDGTPFVWSTERMFRIYPGTTAGQFLVQEIPGGKGLWAEYSLTVQSNGIADQSVSWVGKDGIYDWSTVGGLRSLTDRDMYPYFPHDNQVGIPFNTLFPGFPSLTLGVVGAPSFSSANMKYHRLTWFQGELFYDYPTVNISNVYFTLVYDSKSVQGWVSLDKFSTGANPMVRGIEIAANNMKVGRGPLIHDYTGASDNGTDISCVMFTRQDDGGDARSEKLFGDMMVDLDAGLAAAPGITVFPLVNYGANTTGTSAAYTNSSRSQFTQDLTATGLGYLSKTFGFYATWVAGAAPASLYGYTFAYVPKPEYTTLRATDKTDDGYVGAKYLRGLCIESNTDGVARTVDVLVDNTVVATLTVNSANQLELPFAITPVVGSEFQLQPTDTDPWQLFQVRWTWEKWPDLTLIESPWMDLGTTKPKYIRGFTVPISGPTTLPITFTAHYDATSILLSTGTTPTGLAVKSPAQYSFLPPILAHQIKLVPVNPARVWYDEIKWDAEEWPERAILNGPYLNLGTSQAKYLRSFELPIETGGVPAVMELHYDQQPTAITGQTATETFTNVTTSTLSKNVFPFVPSSPIIAHVFQLKSNTLARFWDSEAKWDFEVWPELSDASSPWMNAGDPGAKFMQGLVMPIDTNGQAVTFDLVYDGGSAVIGPLTTTAGHKTPVPWSYSTPFIAHEVQLTPRTPCRIWHEEIKWIWEPAPELTYTWETQETNHDIAGFHYFGPQAFIAYIGGTDQPTLTVTTQYGSVTYTLPASNGAYTRAQIPMQPQKAKWRRYRLVSSQGIRVYLRDTAVLVKGWGDTKAFTAAQPFGEISRAAGARI